jgi:hypothetical protein
MQRVEMIMQRTRPLLKEDEQETEEEETMESEQAAPVSTPEAQVPEVPRPEDEEPLAEPEKPELVPLDDVPLVPQLYEPPPEPEQPEFVPSDDAPQEIEPPVEPEKPESENIAQPDEPPAELEEPITPIQDIPSEDGMAHIPDEPPLETDREPAQEVDLLMGSYEDQPPRPSDEPSVAALEVEAQFQEEAVVEDEGKPQSPEGDVEEQEPPRDLLGEEGEMEAEAVSRDDEEWVVVDETVPLTEELVQGEEEEQEELPDFSPEPPEEEEEREEGTPTPEPEEQGQQLPTLGGGQEPLSPYYEVPVPSAMPGVDDLIGDQDFPSDDTPAQPDSDPIDDRDIPSDDTPAQLDDKDENVLQHHGYRWDDEASGPEYNQEDEEQMGSSFIPISVQEVDQRSETSSTAAFPSTPPLSMVVERGSPVPELTEPSVTSQDDEQEEDFVARDQDVEEGDGPPYGEEGQQEQEAVDDLQEEVARETVDSEGNEETGLAFGEDVMEEEEVVDDVQEELHTTGEEMTRTAEGTEDDGAAGDEAEDGGEEGEGEEGEREDGDEGEGGELYEGVDQEEPLPEEDDDGSLQTPIQFEPDPPAQPVENLLDFDPQGGASAGPPPPSDPFGMDPLELVTTPPHKAATEIFGQDPFGAAAATSSEQSYNPFASMGELDPFSMGGQGFGAGGAAAGDSLLMDEPILVPEGGQGGLRPEPDDTADLRDSGVQSPDILPPEHEGSIGGISREPDFGGQGVYIEGGMGFESSADPPPPADDDLLGTPVDY